SCLLQSLYTPDRGVVVVTVQALQVGVLCEQFLRSRERLLATPMGGRFRYNDDTLLFDLTFEASFIVFDFSTAELTLHCCDLVTLVKQCCHGLTVENADVVRVRARPERDWRILHGWCVAVVVCHWDPGIVGQVRGGRERALTD